MDVASKSDKSVDHTGVRTAPHLSPLGAHDVEVIKEEIQEPQELGVLIAIAVPKDHGADNV